MRGARSGSPRFSLVVAALLVLLMILAGLQFVWVGEISRADARRMRESMKVAGGRLAADVDRELTRAYLYFHPDLGQEPENLRAALEERLVAWNADAPHPRIVRDIYLAIQGDKKVSVLHLDYGSEIFEVAEWPGDLAQIGERLERGVNPQVWMSTRAAEGPPNPVRADIPALVMPLLQHPSKVSRAGAPFLGKTFQVNAVILRLDLDYLKEHFLPSLVDESFSSADGLGFDLSIRERSDPHRVIFETAPERRSQDMESADLELSLFSLRPFAELRGMGFQARRLMGAQFGRLALGRAPGRAPGRAHSRRSPGPGGPGGPSNLESQSAWRFGEGAWIMQVRHQAGSLGAAVRITRIRNLSVSFGILGLLVASLAVLVLMTRRTQALAQQQIDFVAGISHELHTPLAAIRSAGENLADGVIEEEQKVRRYGRMIASEGRRLSQLLANVLEYAGMQSGTRSRPMQALLVEEVLDRALEAESGLIEEARVQIERSSVSPATSIVADQAALQSAIQNLIENAVQYGGPGRRVRIGALVTGVSGGSEVAIRVQDEGPGIPAQDLPRIFSPFFRGAASSDGPIPGSGLGLSVVKQIAEAHGGRVTVGRGKGGVGSVFTLHLPLKGLQQDQESDTRSAPKKEL